MATTQDDFDPTKFDEDALLEQLREKSPSATTPSDAPVSTAMPVDQSPREVLPETAATPAGRRGWNNLNLDAPTQTGINAFHGYNDDRALAGTDDDSTKDALRRWLGGLDYNLKGQSKDQIGEFFKGQLANAKDYGLDIRDVKGDKILLNTKERGPEWIDFIEGAGGDNPAFAYQSDYDNTHQLLPADSGLSAALPQKDATSDDGLAQILAEIRALQEGSTSPMDTQALLEQLAR